MNFYGVALLYALAGIQLCQLNHRDMENTEFHRGFVSILLIIQSLNHI